MAAAAVAAGTTSTGTHVGDLPEVCLAQAIALTSPLDACRCAAVSRAFRAAADSDQVWRSFLPQQLLTERHNKQHPPPAYSSKDAYLALCDSVNAAVVDGGGCRVWLERATGARCYALSARTLSLPWDDGEFSWRFTPHHSSRFAEVAELVDCTCLDIYGTLPAAALAPATRYAAYLVYGTAERHRGLRPSATRTRRRRWPWAARSWRATPCASAPTTPRRASSGAAMMGPKTSRWSDGRACVGTGGGRWSLGSSCARQRWTTRRWCRRASRCWDGTPSEASSSRASSSGPSTILLQS